MTATDGTTACTCPRGNCIDCDRPMIKQTAYRTTKTWAAHGFVIYRAHMQCGGCYARSRRHRPGRCDPTRLHRTYPIPTADPNDLCPECTLPINEHRIRVVPEDELARLRRMVGVS